MAHIGGNLSPSDLPLKSFSVDCHSFQNYMSDLGSLNHYTGRITGPAVGLMSLKMQKLSA